LTDDFIETVRNTLPLLQQERIKIYIEQYGLSYYDASLLTDDKNFSDFFEQVIGSFSSPGAKEMMKFKAAANWMLGPVKYWLNDNNSEIDQFPVAAPKIGCIIQMIEDGKLSFSIASTRLFGELIKDPLAEPEELAHLKNLIQDSDTAAIENLIEQVLNKFPEKVDQYKKGKKGLMGLFVGEVMKLSKGTADPAVTNDILSKKLKS
jgi:aspartyl-tRNA(Asn)/glutamyl-tRNA(Gln) amidotransferase subunit B